MYFTKYRAKEQRVQKKRFLLKAPIFVIQLEEEEETKYGQKLFQPLANQ